LGANFNNSTGIGYNTDCTAEGQVRIGNSEVTSIGGFQDWTNISDSRFKSDVREDVKGLAFIKTLRPVTYYKNLRAIDDWWADNYGERDTMLMEKNWTSAESSIRHTGFIAQEVEAAAEVLGFEFSGVDAPKHEKDFYGLRYATLTVPLVKAVQEQQEMIQQLQQQYAQLEQNYHELVARIEGQVSGTIKTE
jgi:hypothetical protein